MKKIILIIIVLVGWYGNYIHKQNNNLAAASTELLTENIEQSESLINSNYKCDGRTHCSQMTSCEEATFFISNCPNTEMDGNHDGVPCEKQWCK